MKMINESIVKASEIMKVLGHPVRIQILNLLSSKKKYKNVGQRNSRKPWIIPARNFKAFNRNEKRIRPSA